MNAVKVNKIIRAQIDRCLSIFNAKQDEYITKKDHKDADMLANFQGAAGLMKTTKKRALLGMWVKHLVSISDMCQSDKDYPIELWEEKITDAINYLLLLKCVIVEEKEH